MKQSASETRTERRWVGVATGALLLIAATLGASVTACSSANANNGGTPATSNPDAGGGTDEDAGPDKTLPPESCDPYQARVTTPELYIGPTGLESKVVAIIESAQKSIDLSIYEIDRKPIVDALVAAQKRGVTVRVVMDKNENAPARSTLKAAGIEVHDAIADYPYFHVKTMIVDADRALVASFNFNSYSMQSERNYGVLDHEADDVADLQAIFDNDFAGKGKNVDLSCSRLVVAPINARDRLKDLIQSADKQLDMSVMYLSDGDLAAAVKARKAAGVAVRILLADPSWITDNAASAKDLAAAGIDVKYMKAYELHAKLLVTDRAAFVGSENFSSNSLDQNREIGVFVTNDEPLAGIHKQFESDWAAGVKP